MGADALRRVQDELEAGGVPRVNDGEPLEASTVEQAHVAGDRVRELVQELRLRDAVLDAVGEAVGWDADDGSGLVETLRRRVVGPGRVTLPLAVAEHLRDEAFHDLKASDLGAGDLRALAALATAIEEAKR